MTVGAHNIALFNLSEHQFECDATPHHFADDHLFLPANVVKVHHVVRVDVMAVVAGAGSLDLCDSRAHGRPVARLEVAGLLPHRRAVLGVVALGSSDSVRFVLVWHVYSRMPSTISV